MKLALGKRGKLWLVVGVMMMFATAVALFIIFYQPDLQHFDRIRVGMTKTEANKVLNGRLIDRKVMSRFEYFGPIYVCTLRASNDYTVTVAEPNSAFLPGRTLLLVFNDLDGEERVVEKEIRWPSMQTIWSHWKRRLGL